MNRDCKNCMAFQPEIYIEEMKTFLHRERCQFNQKLGSAETCEYYCSSQKEHHEMCQKRWKLKDDERKREISDIKNMP